MAELRYIRPADILLKGFEHAVVDHDLIITGTGAFGTNVGDIFLRTDDNTTPPNDPGANGGAGKIIAILADQKIFFDGRYSYGTIDTNWFGVDSITDTGGTERVLFTNIGGQARMEDLNIRGLINFKLSGKFVAGVSGDPSYLGHAGSGGWGSAKGNYGIWVSKGWGDTNTSMVGVFKDAYGTTEKHSSNFEIEYIECSDGGNAGIQVKNDNMPDSVGATMYDVSIHDVFVHDTGGEGFYIGHTGTGNNQHTIFLHLKDTIVIRTGREGWQAGRLGKGSILENNVIINTAMGWLRANPDGAWNFQDKGMQIGCRNGGIIIRNNLVASLNCSQTVFFQMDGSGDVRTGDFAWVGTEGDINTHVYLDNNLTIGSNRYAWFMQKSDMDAVTNSYITINDAKLGYRRYRFDVVDPADTGDTFMITGNNNISYINFINTTKQDAGLTLTGVTAGSSFSPVTTRLTETGTTTDVSLAKPEFINSGVVDADFPFTTTLEYWVDLIAAQGGGVTANHRAYIIGDIVRIPSGAFKICIQAHDGTNAAVTSPIDGSSADAYWSDYNDFPDWYQLVVGGTYNLLNIGISDTQDISPTTNPTFVGNQNTYLSL